MFCNGLTFVETGYQDNMLRILDVLLQEECHECAKLNKEKETRVYLCLPSLIKVGLCGTCQVPSEQMDMRETAAKLHVIRTSCRSFLAL